MFLTLSSAYLVLVDVAPTPPSTSPAPIPMSDLVSPFLSLSPTWVDISRMPLALINCMHDEGNAAGRWYMNHSFRLFCNSSCLPVKFIVISAAFQLQLVPLDFCSDLHPRPRQFADCARALAAHRVCLHCNLSTTQHEPLSARHTSHGTRHTSHIAHHTSHVTGNYAFRRCYFTQVQRGHSVCAQVRFHPFSF